ncbi:hypothetical protein HSIEG1_2292 [Enterococcus sp. HSIEG1]|nr:hypothetical protein HSIEG1_2292 [Enterococcus sp. HSIEG1]MCU7700577.1 hypothetical protein [Enterococcus gallinarum]
MGMWISLVSFLAVIVSGILLIIAAIKKRPKKDWDLFYAEALFYFLLVQFYLRAI